MDFSTRRSRRGHVATWLNVVGTRRHVDHGGDGSDAHRTPSMRLRVTACMCLHFPDDDVALLQNKFRAVEELKAHDCSLACHKLPAHDRG